MTEHTEHRHDGLGVAVGSLFVSISTAEASVNSPTSVPVIPDGTLIPPSVLLPRLNGEPLRLDFAFPVHPRGLGNVWPPESELNSNEHGGRFPLAYALQEFASSHELPPWTWTTPEGETKNLTAPEAIAGAFAAVTAVSPKGRGPHTLVIGNHLSMLRQQQLIDACRSHGCDVKLLWRPVAAALVWCKTNGQSLLDNDALQIESMGTLLCIHLGIEQFEFSTIELRKKIINGSPCIIPARRRPPSALRPFPSTGLELLHRMAEVDVDQQSEPMSQREKWQKLWASPWPIETIKQLCEATSDLPSTQLIHRDLWRVHNSKPASKWNENVWAGDRLHLFRFPEMWSERSREILAELSQHNIVGAVITGELASVFVADNWTLSQQVLADLRVVLPPDRVLVDDEPISQHSILADGAALYSAMIAEGKPSYLDTLPRIQLAAYVTGTPGWLPLLNDADDYVDGGKIWHRPMPVSGLRALMGTDRLEVTLSHEEFDTARKISSQFPQKLPKDVGIKLSVSVEPAQGNARVEIIPEQPELFGSRRLFLEWRKMEVLTQKPEKWLEENLPTLFPSCLRRASSETLWKRAADKMTLFCSYPTAFPASASAVKTSLLIRQDATFQPGPNQEANPTAVDSDGIPGSGITDQIDLFVRTAAARLFKENRAADPDLMRAIAYTSTAYDEFSAYLSSLLRDHGLSLQQHELAACGWCLRDPKTIAVFAKKFQIRLQTNSTTGGHNDWLKSFGEVLRYREDATRAISTAACENLTRGILKIFSAQLDEGNFHSLFRNSALCLTFLLRRRAFDDDFLKPETPTYTQVRVVFLRALGALPRHRTGGTIDPRKIVQLMLNYLDRQGPPVLSGGIELRNLVE